MCERARGMRSGSLEGNPNGSGWKGEGRGRMANAPPPEAFQLTLMYRCDVAVVVHASETTSSVLTEDAAMRFVSQALADTFTLSTLYSFFPCCPKT